MGVITWHVYSVYMLKQKHITRSSNARHTNTNTDVTWHAGRHMACRYAPVMTNPRATSAAEALAASARKLPMKSACSEMSEFTSNTNSLGIASVVACKTTHIHV